MALEDRITTESMLAYASAGIELARTTQRLRDDGYGSMIIPSRGATPFIRVAQAYYRSVVVPLMPAQDRLAKGFAASVGPLNLALDMPFTADAGRIPVDGLSPAQIRRYWARVVAAIVRGRMDDPNYRLFRFIRDEVCKVGHHDVLERNMKSERLLFVDTVVSGRAVSEIVDAFDAEGMDQIHYLLLMDENGAAMKPPYAARIQALARAGRATLIGVPHLFTEDQGPAVSGIWSVVVPAVMDLAREEPGMQDGFVGAGLYYHEVTRRCDRSNEKVTQAIGQLNGLLFQSMFAAADPDHVDEDLRHLGSGFAGEKALQRLLDQPAIYRQWLDEQVGMYLEHLGENRLFHQESTLHYAAGRLRKGLGDLSAQVDISSSHCLRVHLKDEDAKRLMRRFRTSLGQPYWADAERTRRA